MGDAQGHAATAGAPATAWGRWAIPVVWAIAAVGSGLVVAGAYSGRRDWFGDSSPTAVYASREPHGFVGRVSASIAGAVVAVAVGALALLPVVL